MHHNGFVTNMLYLLLLEPVLVAMSKVHPVRSKSLSLNSVREVTVELL